MLLFYLEDLVIEDGCSHHMCFYIRIVGGSSCEGDRVIITLVLLYGKIYSIFIKKKIGFFFLLFLIQVCHHLIRGR